VLRETMSRGLCGLVCPSRTSECGGEGDCVKEGRGSRRVRERERTLGLLLCHAAAFKLPPATFAFASCCLLRVCVFITAVPIIKLFAWGEGFSGGHVLRETTPVWTSLPITQ
jgi:hypothetical protein